MSPTALGEAVFLQLGEVADADRHGALTVHYQAAAS